MEEYLGTNTTAERLPYPVKETTRHTEAPSDSWISSEGLKHSTEETTADYKNSLLVSAEKTLHISNITTETTLDYKSSLLVSAGKTLHISNITTEYYHTQPVQESQ